MNKKIFLSLKVSLSLSLMLIITNIAKADYKPPSNQQPPKYSSSQLGVRGRCPGHNVFLEILAPQNYVGQTASSRPTFAWFFNSSESFPLEFRLYEYVEDDQQELIYESKTTTQPHITTLSLPEAIPDLEKNKRYLWQVAVICNPNNPSLDVVSSAEFELAEIPADLAEKLSRTEDSLTRSELYADAGFWYDAFDEAVQSENYQHINILSISIIND